MTRILIFVFTLAGAYPTSAHSDTTRTSQEIALADDAATCAALFSMLTSLGARFPGFGDHVTQLSLMFKDAVSFNDPRIKNMGELDSRIDISKRKIGWWYELNPSAVFDLYHWCNSWRGIIADTAEFIALVEKNAGEPSGREFFKNFPKPPSPSTIKREKIDTVETLIRTAFILYETIGGYTIGDFETWLKEEKMSQEELRDWMKTLGE